jgi:hypothetical protein
MATNWRLTGKEVATIAYALQSLQDQEIADIFGFSSIGSDEIKNLRSRFVQSAEMMQDASHRRSQGSTCKCRDCCQ